MNNSNNRSSGNYGELKNHPGLTNSFSGNLSGSVNEGKVNRGIMKRHSLNNPRQQMRLPSASGLHHDPSYGGFPGNAMAVTNNRALPRIMTAAGERTRLSSAMRHS